MQHDDEPLQDPEQDLEQDLEQDSEQEPEQEPEAPAVHGPRLGRGALHFWSLAILVAVLELLLALYNPRWNNPDELSHTQHVAFLRQHGRLPDPYREEPKVVQDKHPPLMYALGAALVAVTDPLFAGDAGVRWPLPGPYDVTLRPREPVTELGIKEGQLFLLRLLMAAFTVGTACYLLAAARLVLPDQPRLAWALAGGLMTVPQMALAGASVTPDTPLTFFAAATWFHLLRRALGEGRRRDLLLGGLWLGLALLCKAPAVFLLAATVGLAMVGQASLWERLLRCAVPTGIGLVMAGWWYLRNALRYGDPFQMRSVFETFSSAARFSPMGGPEWEAILTGMVQSFFGFWHAEILLPAPVLLGYQLVAGVLAAGLVALVNPERREGLPDALRQSLPPALLVLVVLAVLVVLGNIGIPSPQGRYFYPALGPLVCLAAAGLMALYAPREGFAWFLLPPAAALLTLVCFVQVVLTREAVDRRHAAGAGGVLFYEDGGLPAGHPHRVGGWDLPDQAQLGRRTPWRTLDVDPAAVTYRFPIAAPKPLQLRLLCHNPDPSLPALAEASGRLRYSAQELFAGPELLHRSLDITPTVRELIYALPGTAVVAGQLELRLAKTAGAVASVSELWIEEPWLRVEPDLRPEGPLLFLVNRLPRPLPALVLWQAVGVAGGILGAGVEHAEAAPGRSEQGLRLPDDALGAAVVRTAVLVGGQGPFAEWQGEGLATSSGRILGVRGVAGGYVLAGPRRGEELCRITLPEGLAGPALLELHWQRSTLRFDQAGRIGRGAKDAQPVVQVESVELRIGDETVARRLEAADFPRLRHVLKGARAGTVVSVRVLPEGSLVELDFLALHAAPVFFR